MITKKEARASFFVLSNYRSAVDKNLLQRLDVDLFGRDSLLRRNRRRNACRLAHLHAGDGNAERTACRFSCRSRSARDKQIFDLLGKHYTVRDMEHPLISVKLSQLLGHTGAVNVVGAATDGILKISTRHNVHGGDGILSDDMSGLSHAYIGDMDYASISEACGIFAAEDVGNVLRTVN